MTTTTPIEQVPAACAALWAPYGVTKVPPANLTDATPQPPPVFNATNGAVSDTDALAWAVAANRAAVWDRWAEKYDQPALLKVVLSESLVPNTELVAMSKGAQVDQPDCSSFGTKYGLFPLGADGAAFFSDLGQTAGTPFVLAVTFPGPCQITAVYPDGHSETLFSYSGAGTTIFAGSIVHETVLGDIWRAQAAADCGLNGPKMWCKA